MVVDGAAEVVDVGTAELVTGHSGAKLAAVAALDCLGSLNGNVHIDQGTVNRLIHLRGPQGTVQMDPGVHVHVKKPRSG